MIEMLRKLCLLDGTSGDEGAVRDYIIQELDGHCEYKTDPLGSIIAFKKGKKAAKKRLLLDAHTDEVGLIITHITADGFLKFKTVGGIDTAVLLTRKVKINGQTVGVIGGKPVHLLHGDEGKKLPSADSLTIDIGAKNHEEAESVVRVGGRAVLASDFTVIGDKILSKAIDDRVGCAILLRLLTEESEYDFHASFSVQEEVGLRGAKAAAFGVDPEAAIVLEATTAADIAEVDESKKVCTLSGGATLSFMDGSTVYDRAYYDAAMKSGIPCQPKCAVAGGNNAGAIHLSRGGVRTLGISVPCRYIHSASSMADLRDVTSAYCLAKYMINRICSGELS